MLSYCHGYPFSSGYAADSEHETEVRSETKAISSVLTFSVSATAMRFPRRFLIILQVWYLILSKRLPKVTL